MAGTLASDSAAAAAGAFDKLEEHHIHDLPPSFYYIPNFITAEEEAALLAKITTSRYISLSKRRLQVYPSQLTPSNVLLSATSLPTWLTDPICQRFKDLAVFAGTKHGAPNHCLVNEYEPGQGIMPHEDGGAYASVVATVSLGAPIVLDLYEKKAKHGNDDDGVKHEAIGSGPEWRILQEERSLLVTRGEAYEVLMHGIGEQKVDQGLRPDEEGQNGVVNWTLLGDQARFSDGAMERQLRVSLTFRDVLKVSTMGHKLFGKR